MSTAPAAVSFAPVGFDPARPRMCHDALHAVPTSRLPRDGSSTDGAVDLLNRAWRGLVREAAQEPSSDSSELTSQNTSQDVAIIDWDTLFHAVKHQLRSSVEPQLGLEPQAQNTLDLVRTHVLRCVAALDQLQLTMSHHIALNCVPQSALAASQTAPAQTLVK